MNEQSKDQKKTSFLIALGSKVHNQRMLRGISHQDLANATGLPLDSIVRLEEGQWDIGILELFDIAAALEIDPKEWV